MSGGGDFELVIVGACTHRTHAEQQRSWRHARAHSTVVLDVCVIVLYRKALSIWGDFNILSLLFNRCSVVETLVPAIMV